MSETLYVLKHQNRRSIVHSVLAVCLFAALFLAAFCRKQGNAGGQQPEIVVFGDSICGQVRDETSVPARLQELLGRRVYNAAMGGTAMAQQKDGRRQDDIGNCFSMIELAKAVEAGDFGVQRSVLVRERIVEYFPEVIEGLAEVDFSQVDTVLLEYGINDYHGVTRIQDPEDPYDAYTFLGALRTAVESLRRVNPRLRIVLVTPTYAWYVHSEERRTYEETDLGEGTLNDYVNAVIQAAEELDVEVIDVYHALYPHENWEDWELYTIDGVHPNEAGRRRLAEYIADALTEYEGTPWNGSG